jgi:PTH1 family peptidyl-tRNA hydrolase
MGFMALDELARRLGRFSGWRREGESLRGQGRAGRHTVLLVKPQTFMNRSGDAMRELLREGLLQEEILVVADDVHLPLGTVRLRAGGGSGGHQGLESIREEIGTTNFARLRIGVGPGPTSADLPDFVLASFTAEERERVPGVLEAAASAAYDAAASGLTVAMNRWNRFEPESVEE